MGIFKRSNLAELIFGQKLVSHFANIVRNELAQVWHKTKRCGQAIYKGGMFSIAAFAQIHS